MANGKVLKKYAPIIWIGLLFACIVRNAYTIYLNIMQLDSLSALNVLWMIIRYALSYGVVPMLVVLLCAVIVWQVSASRFVRSIPRMEFCYLVMAGTAIAKFSVGIIEVFSILESSISTVTSTVLDFTLLTGVMIALFFFAAKTYRLNPVEKYNAFKMWFMVYMIVAGFVVIFSNALYLSVLDGGAFGGVFWEIMYELGQMMFISELQVGASIAVICIYFAYLIAVIIIGEMLRKQSDRFRNPETRGEFYERFDNRGYRLRNDADSVFGETNSRAGGNRPDEKVFDEFDI